MARVNAQYLSASVINLDCRPRCGALDKLHWTRCTGRLHWVQECTTVWNWDCNSADAEVWYCDIQVYTAHCTGVIKIKRWRVSALSAACGCKWLHTGVEPRSEGRTSDTWNTWWGLRLAMMIGMMTIAIVMRVIPRKPFFLATLLPPWTWPHTKRSQYLKPNLAWCHLNCMSFGVVLQKRRSLSTKGVWAKWKWSDFLISRN